MTIDILIVDDEEGIRNLVKGILQDEGYSVRLAAEAQSAYKQIESKVPDLLILDIWLQESHHDGLQILENVKKAHKFLPVLMISGHGTIETAVSAIKSGAYDFIEKPFKSDRLLLMINRALENAALKKENETLKMKAGQISEEAAELIAIPQSVQQVLDKVSPTNSRVFITGEAGTGKNLAARYIHQNSKRSEYPIISVNCASLQPERLEVEIFGSVDGILNEPAKIGALELAKSGTLILDEVLDMPASTQGKLLRLLQEDSYKKIGDSKSILANIRILATTSKNVDTAISEGQFRQDLYYRLNVVAIHMPPLRKRINDLPGLIENISKIIGKNNNVPVKPFDAEALSTMQNYMWPGNLRQLRNVLEWVSIMAPKDAASYFGIDNLPPEVTGKIQASDTPLSMPSFENRDLLKMTLREAREEFERDYLLAQIKKFSGNISKTSQFVGMERSALHRKLKSLEVISAEKEAEPEQNNDLPKKVSNS